MEILKSDKYGFTFEEAYHSSDKIPSFIGKINNNKHEDIIRVSGKGKSFSICYSMPINDKSTLNEYSIDNMKNFLKLIIPTLNDSSNMDSWVEIANKSINNCDDSHKVIDDKIVSFWKNTYTNSVVISIETLGCYDIE